MKFKETLCKIIFGIVFMILIWIIVACNKPNENQNNQVSNIKIAQTTSTKPIVQATTNTVTLGVDEKTDRKYHESEYEKKLKIVFVLNKLTELNSKFRNKDFPLEEHKSREKTILSLVDGLSENASDLITLAQICRMMEIHGRGLNKTVSPYDIAFFHCIKVLSTKHKDTPTVKDEIEKMKKLNIDGHLAEEFMLAVEGKNPSFMHLEEKSN